MAVMAVVYKESLIDEEALGFVGEITAVNDKLISVLMDQGYIPVITPIAVPWKDKN